MEMHFSDSRTTPAGGTTIFASTDPTNFSSKYVPKLQLSPTDAWHTKTNLTNARFGIDAPFGGDDAGNPRRTLKLSIEDAELVARLRSIEDRVVKMATERSEELWGAALSEPVVREKLKSVLKDDGGTATLITTKIDLTKTQVFSVKNVAAPDGESAGSLDLEHVENALEVVKPGVDCIANVKLRRVWKSSIGFGIALDLTELAVWAHEDPELGFNFGGAEVTILPREW